MASQTLANGEPFVCDEIIELDDVLAQLEQHYGSVQDALLVAAHLLIIKQIKLLREDIQDGQR